MRTCPWCKAALQLVDTQVRATEGELTYEVVSTYRCAGAGKRHEPLVLQRSERLLVVREDEAAQHGIRLPEEQRT